MNECENGVNDTRRIWWVQAETVIGFLNRYQKDPEKKEYLQAAEDEWNYIKTYMLDPRDGSEWFWYVKEDHTPGAVSYTHLDVYKRQRLYYPCR